MSIIIKETTLHPQYNITSCATYLSSTTRFLLYQNHIKACEFNDCKCCTLEY